jgi:hypothetical protein
MGAAEKIWGALSSFIKLEDKVKSQAEAMKSQQSKTENLTQRVIRLDTDLLIKIWKSTQLHWRKVGSINLIESESV